MCGTEAVLHDGEKEITGRLRGHSGWLLFIVSHRWPQVPPKLSPSRQAMVTGELFSVTSSPNDQG